MTVTNKRRVAARVVVTMLACGVTLSACSDAQVPEETTSSSSSSSSSPSSSSTRSNPDGARAIAVVKKYTQTSNDLRLDPTMPTGELGAYGTSEAYHQRAFDIRRSREQGKRYRGRVKIVEAEASRRSATSQQVVVCTDLTGTTVTDKNGKEIDLPYDRLERIYTVDKSDGAGEDGKWRVTAEKVKQTC